MSETESSILTLQEAEQLTVDPDPATKVKPITVNRRQATKFQNENPKLTAAIEYCNYYF